MWRSGKEFTVHSLLFTVRIENAFTVNSRLSTVNLYRLSRAGGENHIPRVRPNQLRHLFARRLGHRLQFRARSFAPLRMTSSDGLPHSVVRYGIMASRTCGRMGVVALWQLITFQLSQRVLSCRHF